MKRILLLLTALSAAVGATAQPGARIHRTEVIPYDTRHAAQAGELADASQYIPFAPRIAGDRAVLNVEIPYAWTDGSIYLHLENLGQACTLVINGTAVAEIDDPLTPADFAIKPYIRQGRNEFRLEMRPGAAAKIDAAGVARERFTDCYLYAQNSRSIRDFEIALVPDSAGRDFGVLRLDLIAQNAYNYDEPVEVGYDIYSPQGKLLDFNIREVTVAGNSTDTVRFRPYIYDAFKNKWQAGGKTPPPLYRVMLFTRRKGVYKEYMPLSIGFGRAELADGRILFLGKEIQLVKARYNAAADRKTTLAEIRKLKAAGKNTLCPDYPQPAWFYRLCDQEGLYVIDCANIHAQGDRTDRRVGGTPANDPRLAAEFLRRVQSMYYRSRNFTCVVAYSLGGRAGNGYNMYKAYEWLKSVERSRPVIYEDADGEWNSDL